ncbi:hypothetical protein GCM10012286_06360 [Streptomyces lasiicapitis]|uniref:Uncharacterized protein n=1 Tax=Streptomyces lasiicapitis TaxID=1923961 RepID=A0ABQ2LII8_9ACTN|nr:hypothetical protein GCM10012286_06360 [Streptomyces lasiicapitis]
MVQGLAAGDAVEADHEGVAEPALVGGGGGAQGGGRGPVAGARGERGLQGFGGEGFGEVVGSQVVGRLVGGGQQGVQVRVGPVGCEAVRPVAASAAGGEGALGGFR